MESRQDACADSEWLKPGLIGRVPHLKGEAGPKAHHAARDQWGAVMQIHGPSQSSRGKLIKSLINLRMPARIHCRRP